MSDRARELLFGFALGTLEPRERGCATRLFETGRVTPESKAEMQRMLLALAHVPLALAPPASLRAAILAGREASTLAHTAAARREMPLPAAQQELPGSAQLFTCRHDEGVWQDTGLPGVRYKKLFVDEARDYVTLLLLLEAGASYPSHQHGGYEECLVLEGEVRAAEVRLSAGDYQRMGGGSRHHALHTDEGCLLLIIASQGNEILSTH